MRMLDTKALSQFMKNVLDGKDVVLKSDEKQKYSYVYVADASSAIVFLLEKGKNLEAYNVANPEIMDLKDLADIVPSFNRKKVTFDFSKEESLSYSKIHNAIQSILKIKALGWNHRVSIKDGLEKTFNVLIKTI